MKSDWDIDVDSKETFKWSENSPEIEWKRKFSFESGSSSFKLSHLSLKLTSLDLHLSKPLPTNKLIESVKFWVG